MALLNWRKGKRWKNKRFMALLDKMGHCKHEKVRSLRKTFMEWRREILASMHVIWSNGRVEGHGRTECNEGGKVHGNGTRRSSVTDTLAKLVKRKGFGFKNFNNFRLKLLNASF